MKKQRQKLTFSEGDRYENLTVIKEVQPLILPSGQRNRAVLCRCDCGTEKVIRTVHLTRSKTASCGCKTGEHHNMTGTRLHNIWRGMRNRCKLDSYIDYHRYKGRGIKVCEEWDNSFTAFMVWALNNGYSEGLQIDRINNDGNYEPSNCRFVSAEINANNKSITRRVNYKGSMVAIIPLLRAKGIPEIHTDTIWNRITRGWDHTKAVDTPIRQGNYRRKSA
jgi:hypothetical protein